MTPDREAPGPAARPVCDHHWSYLLHGGMSVGICTFCGDPNWDDLREQREQRERAVAAARAEALREAASALGEHDQDIEVALGVAAYVRGWLRARAAALAGTSDTTETTSAALRTPTSEKTAR